MENPDAITRDVEADGTVALRAGRGAFRYRRPRPGVLTIAIVQHLSQTGKLIQLYTDPELFEAHRQGAR